MKMAYFKDVLEIKNGRNQKAVEDPNGKYPIYGSGGVIGYANEFLCDAGTVLIGRKGTINKPIFVNEPLWNVDTAFGLCANKKILLPKYLFYFCSNFNFHKLNTTVTIPSLTKANLLNIRMILPQLDDQHRIVSILDKADAICRKRKECIKMLDELVKARFVEMFGDTKLNSKDLKLINLEEIANVGSSKRVFINELTEYGIPFYRGTEVGMLAEGKNITPELYISEIHYNELIKSSGTPQIGDLLLSSICPDGRIWLVDTDMPFYFKDGRVLWISSINKKFNSVFILHALKNRLIADYNSFASGTTFAELKIYTLKKCKIFNVPISEQKIFSSFALKIEAIKSSMQAQLQEAETLKAALMQQYFSQPSQEKICA